MKVSRDDYSLHGMFNKLLGFYRSKFKGIKTIDIVTQLCVYQEDNVQRFKCILIWYSCIYTVLKLANDLITNSRYTSTYQHNATINKYTLFQ